MTKAQKKIVVNGFVTALLLLIGLVFSDWILKNWEALMWPLFAVMIIVEVLGQKNKITRADGHLELNRIIEENPWIKTFYVAYGIVIAIADYYAISNHINLLEEIGSFWLIGGILSLFLPIVIIKLKEAYIEAGR